MDTEEALRNVLSDNTCCAWIDGYSLNYYLRKEVVYDDIVTDWADTKEFCYAAAVLNTLPNADKMVSLLNQYASSISNKETQALLSACLLDKMNTRQKNGSWQTGRPL